MHTQANKAFWIVFIGFCIYAVLFLRFFRAPVPPEFSNADAVISTGTMLLCGAVLRYWFYKNQDKFKR